MQWYYALNGQRYGPVSQVDLEKLVTDGVIKADTLVWRDGLAQWQAYGSLGGEAGVPPVPPAAVDDGTEVCAVSGKRYPRNQMINYAGKWISTEYRDEFFRQRKESVAAQTLQGVTRAPVVYGGFWIRFVARFLDSLILGLISGVFIGLVVGGAIGLGVFGEPEAAGVLFILFCLLAGALGIGLQIGYHIYFIRKYDATPGKMALGLKEFRADGSKLSTGRIVGRFFAQILSSFFFCIGYIIAAFDDQKRALHDHICDTRVVKVN
jgi:uncharacterized RDD family membrane protein YckC